MMNQKIQSLCSLVPTKRSSVTRLATSLMLFGGHIGILVGILSVQDAYGQVGTEAQDRIGGPTKKTEAVATLAGGCFWCTEAVYERMKGVNEVVSGYIGGSVPNPTYEQVCQKRTGHAEAVEVYYDPNVVSYEELLEVFFKTHDPTTANQQGNDYGPQYRSVVFYHDEQQKLAAVKYVKKLEVEREYRRKIVTEIVKADRFWEAEEYHQDYYKKNPTAGYCRAVVSKKVKKFDNLFEDKKKQ